MLNLTANYLTVYASLTLTTNMWNTEKQGSLEIITLIVISVINNDILISVMMSNLSTFTIIFLTYSRYFVNHIPSPWSVCFLNSARNIMQMLCFIVFHSGKIIFYYRASKLWNNLPNDIRYNYKSMSLHSLNT